MRKVNLALSFVLAACGSAAPATGTLAGPASNRSDDERVLLRYAPPVGLRWVTETEATMDFGFGPMEMRAAVRSVVVGREGGVTSVESSVVRIAMRALGEDRPVPETDLGARIERFDVLGGRVAEGEASAPLAAPLLTTFPAEPVGVGSRWTVMPEMHGRSDLPPVEFELSSFEGEGDARVAVLHGTVAVPDPSVTGSNVPGPSLSLEARVDVSTGVVRSLSMRLEGAEALPALPSARGNEGARVRIEVRMTTTPMP